jgi:hypothetical protein
MSESIQMLKKIGANQILGKVKKVVEDYCPENGSVVDAYSVYGSTNGIQKGTSQFGEWTAFLGRLGAINHITGQRFEGLKCYIPEPLQTAILEGLSKHEEVEFAFTVSIKRRDDLKEGYEYLVKPHREMQEADPLEALRSRIPAIDPPKKVSLALEAPTDDTKPGKAKSK